MSAQVSTPKADVQREGVVRDADGYLVIPATQRPDGSWRKPVRVREGYVPQEEVPLYRSRGVERREIEAQKSPVVGLSKADYDRLVASGNTNKSPVVGLSREDYDKMVASGNAPSAAAGKKRRKKKPKAAAEPFVDSVAEATKNLSLETRQTSGDLSKKLKCLEKKLRQIEALERKIDSKELASPDPDQLKKVERKKGVLDEINELQILLQSHS